MLKIRLSFKCFLLLTLATVAQAQTDDANNTIFNINNNPTPNAGVLGAVLGSFAIPGAIGGGLPVGLENDGSGNLLGTELNDDIFYSMDTTGNLLSGPTAASNTGNPIGITSDGTNLYITDTVDDDVDIYDLMGNFISSFPVGGFSTFPEGITIPNFANDLYIVNGSGGNNVGQFSTAGVLLNTFPVDGSSQDGIAFDDARCVFWIYDSGTDTVRSYDSSFTALDTFPGTGAANFGIGEGLAVIGNSLYVMAPGPDIVVEFDIAAAQSASNVAALCPSATAADPIPTANEYGLVILSLLLLMTGTYMRRYS